VESVKINQLFRCVKPQHIPSSLRVGHAADIVPVQTRRNIESYRRCSIGDPTVHVRSLILALYRMSSASPHRKMSKAANWVIWGGGGSRRRYRIRVNPVKNIQKCDTLFVRRTHQVLVAQHSSLACQGTEHLLPGNSQKSRCRFSAVPDFLRSSGSGMSAQPRDYN
jgi:hypothetical protein